MHESCAIPVAAETGTAAIAMGSDGRSAGTAGHLRAASALHPGGVRRSLTAPSNRLRRGPSRRRRPMGTGSAGIAMWAEAVSVIEADVRCGREGDECAAEPLAHILHRPRTRSAIEDLGPDQLVPKTGSGHSRSMRTASRNTAGIGSVGSPMNRWPRVHELRHAWAACPLRAGVRSGGRGAWRRVRCVRGQPPVRRACAAQRRRGWRRASWGMACRTGPP